MRFYNKIQGLVLKNSTNTALLGLSPLWGPLGSYKIHNGFLKYTAAWFEETFAGQITTPLQIIPMLDFLAYRSDLENSCGIYAIYSKTDNKFYIGSGLGLYARLKNHFRGQKSNDNLQEAIRKYGMGDFLILILHQIGVTKDKELRKKLQNTLYNLELEQLLMMPMVRLYNKKLSAIGGSGPVLEPTRIKIGASKRGIPRTAETIVKIRDALTEYYQTPEGIATRKGISAALRLQQQSQETRDKRSRAMVGTRLGADNPAAVAVSLTNIITGEVLHFGSIAQAGAHLSCPTPTLRNYLRKPLSIRKAYKKVWLIKYKDEM